MNKQQQIEEIAKVIFDYVDSRTDKDKVVSIHIFNSVADEEIKQISHNMGIAKALYNAGYRKVPDGAVDEITRLNNVEAELQELNIKYYNEAKNLRRQLADIEAENEKRLKASEDFATKHCRMKCEIAKMRVKEFAINLKKVIHEKDYVQGYAEIGLIEEIDELLKEYEND